MRTRSLAPALGLALFAFASLGAGLVATSAAAQRSDPERPSDLLLRIDAPVTVAEADTLTTLVVIGDDAVVRGTVRDQLVVVGGTARVIGAVRNGVAVFGGALELGPTARVGGDVFLYRSALSRAPGAAVSGVIESSRGPAYGQWLAAGFWLSTTIVVLVFGLLFATLGRTPLLAAADTLARRPGQSAVTTLVAGGVAVAAAMVGFATVIGIPLGIAILVFLLPALGFVGHLVAGTALGARLVERLWRTPADAHPLAAVALGLLVLQAVGFIPLVGGLVVLASGVLGAGALVYRAWAAWRGRPAVTLAAAPAH